MAFQEAVAVRRSRLLTILCEIIAENRWREVEASCLAVLALAGGDRRHQDLCRSLAREVEAWQMADGLWCAAPGVDSAGAFATALAMIALDRLGGGRDRVERACKALL
jgi:hypothetical protein